MWFERKKGEKKIGRFGNLSYLLVPETMSPVHVRSEVFMAPFHVRSKVCIAPFQVRSKFAVFAMHMYGSNADFAPHMEGSHADFALHMERRHSFRDKILTKIAISANFEKLFCQTTYI